MSLESHDICAEEVGSVELACPAGSQAHLGAVKLQCRGDIRIAHEHEAFTIMVGAAGEG
jgi:hypothetical protein